MAPTCLPRRQSSQIISKLLPLLSLVRHRFSRLSLHAYSFFSIIPASPAELTR